MQLSADTGEDLVRLDGDAGRPRLDERNVLGAPSTEMCSAPSEAAAAAIANGAKSEGVRRRERKEAK